jgi:hypothetical protein
MGSFPPLYRQAVLTKITHYDDILEKIKAGKLTYWHYNTKGLGSARYEALEQLSVNLTGQYHRPYDFTI